MILDMVVWGFFSAMGWMLANWTVDKVMPDKPPSIAAPVEDKSIVNDKKDSSILKPS